jgi:hypothetical protein
MRAAIERRKVFCTSGVVELQDRPPGRSGNLRECSFARVGASPWSPRDTPGPGFLFLETISPFESRTIAPRYERLPGGSRTANKTDAALALALALVLERLGCAPNDDLGGNMGSPLLAKDADHCPLSPGLHSQSLDRVLATSERLLVTVLAVEQEPVEVSESVMDQADDFACELATMLFEWTAVHRLVMMRDGAGR